MSNKTNGQILIELILTLGIASILISALVGGLISARQGRFLSANILTASFLLQEMVEATRSIRESGWEEVALNGTFHPKIVSNGWILASGSEKVGNFTRQLFVSETRRDTNGNIVASGGVIDPSTKKFIASVSWTGYGETIQTPSCFDVPVPARADPAPNGPRDGGVTLSDMLATLFYVGTRQGGPPNSNGVDYDSDKGIDINGDLVVDIAPDGIADGRDYDFDNDGAVTIGDVLAVQGQIGQNCSNLISTASFGPNSINQTFYLSRYLDNTTWNQTTKNEFDSGTKTSVVTTATDNGEVTLASGSSGSQTSGNQFIATSSLGLLLTSTSSWFSVRFTAQSSKTTNRLEFYQNSQSGTGSANYAVELRANNGGNPGVILASGTYSPSGGTRWVNVNLNSSVNLTSGTIYHIVIRRISGARNLEVRYSRPLNNAIPYDGTSDSASNVLFSFTNGVSWIPLINSQPIYLLGFSDATVDGNPLHQPYDDITSVTRIFDGNFIGEQFSVIGSNRTITTVSFYARRISSTTPEDNLYLTLYDVTNNSVVETGTIVNRTAITTTYNWYNYTFTAPRTLIAGRTYRFFLSSPLTTNNRSYVLSAQETQNGAVYISKTFDGSNSIYVRSADSGTSWNLSPDRDVPFRYTVTSSADYQTSGTFESATFGSLGVNLGFNYLTWITTKPASTDIKFQIATSNSDGPIWNFVGPDATATTYFDNPGAIPLGRVSASYTRYKAYFSGDGNSTPILESVSINWSP